MDILGFLITMIFFVGAPLVSVVLAIISLFRYCYAKHKNSHSPDSYSEKQIKARLIWLIATSATAAVLVGVYVSIMILLSMAIAYM